VPPLVGSAWRRGCAWSGAPCVRVAVMVPGVCVSVCVCVCVWRIWAGERGLACLAFWRIRAFAPSVLAGGESVVYSIFVRSLVGIPRGRFFSKPAIRDRKEEWNRSKTHVEIQKTIDKFPEKRKEKRREESVKEEGPNPAPLVGPPIVLKEHPISLPSGERARASCCAVLVSVWQSPLHPTLCGPSAHHPFSTFPTSCPSLDRQTPRYALSHASCADRVREKGVSRCGGSKVRFLSGSNKIAGRVREGWRSGRIDPLSKISPAIACLHCAPLRQQRCGPGGANQTPVVHHSVTQ
jgi:hypothetical protein